MTYKIAIAGAGGIAAFHTAAVADLPNAELVGASARTPGKAEAFCAEHGGRGYTDLATMLDTERPDVLCVTTPSGAHLEPVQCAAQHGIHVFCEKPIEVTYERIDALLEACERGGVRLGAVFQQRLSPLMQTVYDAAAAGRFGTRPVIHAAVPWWRDGAYYAPGRWQGTRRFDGGGALMNQSIHALDLVMWLASATMPGLGPDDNPVARVSALAGVQGHPGGLLEVEDTCLINLALRDGRAAQVFATTAMYPGGLRRFMIGGEGGTAEVLEDQLMTWSFRDEQPGDDATRQRFGGDTTHGGGASDPFALSHANHTANLSAFLAALDSGTEPALNGRVARQAVDTILTSYASAEQGGAPVAVRGGGIA